MPVSTATAMGSSVQGGFYEGPKPAVSEVADVAKALILDCLKDEEMDKGVRCELAKWVISYRYDLRD